MRKLANTLVGFGGLSFTIIFSMLWGHFRFYIFLRISLIGMIGEFQYDWLKFVQVVDMNRRWSR